MEVKGILRKLRTQRSACVGARDGTSRRDEITERKLTSGSAVIRKNYENCSCLRLG